MIVRHKLVFGKIQWKANDCWYACIYMIRSAVLGSKSGAVGATASVHRAPFLGKKLDFGGAPGEKILAENGLKSVASQIKTDNMLTFAMALQKYGPLIIGGTFGAGGAGHFMVAFGCDTEQERVFIYDPAWFRGAKTITWDYVKSHLWMIVGGDDPQYGAVVADDADAFFNQQRARR